MSLTAIPPHGPAVRPQAQQRSIDLRIDELYGQLHDIGFFSDGAGGGVYPSCWDEGEDMLVRAPGLEPGTP